MIVSFFVIYTCGIQVFRYLKAKLFPVNDVQALSEQKSAPEEEVDLAFPIAIEGSSYFDGEGDVKFAPPVFSQRYMAVTGELETRGPFKKVVELGCNSLSLFPFLKHLEGIEEAVFVDINRELLVERRFSITPLTADHLHKRSAPLRVRLLAGNASVPDVSLAEADAVIAIELIEHMYPPDLNELPYCIFGVVQPRLAVITTPNADFNVLFKRNPLEFRDPDHKFEWTRKQFHDWATNIILQYPEYNLTLKGIGPGPEGSSHHGTCSQMAVFARNCPKNCDITLFKANEYEVVEDLNYPFKPYVEPSPEEQVALYLRKYFAYEETTDEYYSYSEGRIEVPISEIFQFLCTVTKDTDILRQAIVKNGYMIEETAAGVEVVVPPSEECSTSAGGDSYDGRGSEEVLFSEQYGPSDSEVEVWGAESPPLSPFQSDFLSSTPLAQQAAGDVLPLKDVCALAPAREFVIDVQALSAGDKTSDSFIEPVFLGSSIRQRKDLVREFGEGSSTMSAEYSKEVTPFTDSKQSHEKSQVASEENYISNNSGSTQLMNLSEQISEEDLSQEFSLRSLSEDRRIPEGITSNASSVEDDSWRRPRSYNLDWNNTSTSDSSSERRNPSIDDFALSANSVKKASADSVKDSSDLRNSDIQTSLSGLGMNFKSAASVQLPGNVTSLVQNGQTRENTLNDKKSEEESIPQPFSTSLPLSVNTSSGSSGFDDVKNLADNSKVKKISNFVENLESSLFDTPRSSLSDAHLPGELESKINTSDNDRFCDDEIQLVKLESEVSPESLGLRKDHEFEVEVPILKSSIPLDNTIPLVIGSQLLKLNVTSSSDKLSAKSEEGDNGCDDILSQNTINESSSHSPDLSVNSYVSSPNSGIYSDTITSQNLKSVGFNDSVNLSCITSLPSNSRSDNPPPRSVDNFKSDPIADSNCDIPSIPKLTSKENVSYSNECNSAFVQSTSSPLSVNGNTCSNEPLIESTEENIVQDQHKLNLRLTELGSSGAEAPLNKSEDVCCKGSFCRSACDEDLNSKEKFPASASSQLKDGTESHGIDGSPQAVSSLKASEDEFDISNWTVDKLLQVPFNLSQSCDSSAMYEHLFHSIEASQSEDNIVYKNVATAVDLNSPGDINGENTPLKSCLRLSINGNYEMEPANGSEKENGAAVISKEQTPNNVNILDFSVAKHEKGEDHATMINRCKSLQLIQDSVEKRANRFSLCCEKDERGENRLYGMGWSLEEVGGCWREETEVTAVDDSRSQSRAADSGYPNTADRDPDMDTDLTPEQVDELLSENESSFDEREEEEEEQHVERPLPGGAAPVQFAEHVENGDVANNNQDGEGNNMDGEEILAFDLVELQGNEPRQEAPERHDSDSEDENKYVSASESLLSETIVVDEIKDMDEALDAEIWTSTPARDWSRVSSSAAWVSPNTMSDCTDIQAGPSWQTASWDQQGSTTMTLETDSSGITFQDSQKDVPKDSWKCESSRTENAGHTNSQAPTADASKAEGNSSDVPVTESPPLNVTYEAQAIPTLPFQPISGQTWETDAMLGPSSSTSPFECYLPCSGSVESAQITATGVEWRTNGWEGLASSSSLIAHASSSSLSPQSVVFQSTQGMDFPSWLRNIFADDLDAMGDTQSVPSPNEVSSDFLLLPEEMPPDENVAGDMMGGGEPHFHS